MDALLDGPRRFSDLQDDLARIAPNVLSQRLRHLEREGLVVASRYSERPPRFVYELTASGTSWPARCACSPSGARAIARPAKRLATTSAALPSRPAGGVPTCERPVDGEEAADLHYA